jgi:UDP-N-acetylmuramoyl-tripeptide--D-alanyl-D-alanine ligase
MESSKSLSKIFNTIFPFRDFLYILQQEEYSNKRFFVWLPRFFLRRNIEKREHIKFTQRARVTLVISVILFVLDAWYAVAHFPLSVVFVFLLVPLYIVVANVIVTPVYDHIKKGIRLKARKTFESKSKSPNGRTKVIAITGSYGKTTVKNFIHELLKYNYKVQMVPGNINSTMGISRWITDYFLEGNDILIVEMDAFAKGRIAKSCQILPPDIAIVTNVGDQHIERFGTRENLRDALGEVFENAKPDAHLIFPVELEAWVNQISKEENQVLHEIEINDKITYRGKTLTDVPLSESNKINLKFALEVADILDIPEDYVQDISKKLIPPDRRQKIGNIFGYEGIDDSYNISYTTAVAGIHEAKLQANARGKKLLVITAGIPELGKDDFDKNNMLGRELGMMADHTIVLNSMFAGEIQKGIGESLKYTVACDLKDAVTKLHESYPAVEWFVLQQPELTDLYY